MKFYILFFLIAFINLNAQTNTSPTNSRTGLSPEELQKAKEMFKQMAGSKDYHEMLKAGKLMAEKLNGIELIDFETIMAVNDQDSIHKIMAKNLAENLTRTQFKSVDEGMELHAKSVALLSKMQAEYPELYLLMKKATSKQLREIREPDKQARREIMLED